MPKSPAASKRDLALAFATAKQQDRSLAELDQAIRVLLADNSITKSILSRTLRGRLRWLLLGR